MTRSAAGRSARAIAVLLGGAAALLISAGCASAPTAQPAAPSIAAATPTARQAPQARTVRIAYRNGTATGDTGTVAVTRGEEVRIEITGDVADEAHLHGYDREVRLTPGTPATIDLTADIPGEFELELHGSGAQLATLQVR